MKALLLALLLGLAASCGAETLRFALIGDTPYNGGERKLLPGMLEAIDATGAAFVVHIGDIKDGRSPCSDEMFADRLALFDDSPLPFVYIPGDNEWTDCHRTSNGGYDPLERLAHLRRVFFAAPRSLGRRTIALASASPETPELTRWQLGPVLFVGLNVPGGDNNRGSRSKPSAEYLNRMPLVLAWLREGFAEARRRHLPAIVIGMQANPDFLWFARRTPNSSYRRLLETLQAESAAFAGEVVLVHGDTHSQRIDQPLPDPATGKPLANFTRIETFGSPFMGWVDAVIDTASTPMLRFEARPYAP